MIDHNVECCDECKTHEDLLKIVNDNMPDEDELYDLAELFKVFGDSTRIRILFVLFESEVCVCDLAETFLKRWIVAVNEKMTPEEVEKDFEGYRDEFKWQLVKSAIVKDYDVKVEAEDMKREGRQIAAAQLQQYGLYGLTDEQLDGFAAKLLEDEKQRQHLYERALDNKVFDVIRENVKLEEQEISMADFEKLFQK